MIPTKGELNSLIEKESKRKNRLASELRHFKHEVEREDEYSWLDALEDAFTLANENNYVYLKRKALRLYKKMGLLEKVDPSKITLWPRRSLSKHFFRLDGAHYQLKGGSFHQLKKLLGEI